MQVPHITTNNPTFGYKHELKTLYKKGKIPFIKYGFYGEELTKDTVTIEHLKLHSKGGQTEWHNIVLSDANKNMERGSKPLSEVINWYFVGRYFEQFRNKQVGEFSGNDYINKAMSTIVKLLNGGQ